MTIEFKVTQKQATVDGWTYQATLSDGALRNGKWSICRWPAGNRHAVRTEMLTTNAKWVCSILQEGAAIVYLNEQQLEIAIQFAND